MQGVDVEPSGEFALVTLIRTKNLVPMTRVLQGWVITNGIGVLWRDGRVDQLLLDEPDDYFADPTDVAITPDGRLAFVTGGGVDEVAVVDIQRMRGVLDAATEEDRRNLLPNHLGVTTEFVERRISVGSNPRGLADFSRRPLRLRGGSPRRHHCGHRCSSASEDSDDRSRWTGGGHAGSKR